MVPVDCRRAKKKLKDIAEYWSAIADGTIRDHDDVFVFEENEEAVKIFMTCATQWRIGFGGDLQGLDYPSLEAVMEMEGTQDRQSTFEKIRIMEYAAMGSANERMRIRAQNRK